MIEPEKEGHGLESTAAPPLRIAGQDQAPVQKGARRAGRSIRLCRRAEEAAPAAQECHRRRAARLGPFTTVHSKPRRSSRPCLPDLLFAIIASARSRLTWNVNFLLLASCMQEGSPAG